MGKDYSLTNGDSSPTQSKIGKASSRQKQDKLSGAHGSEVEMAKARKVEEYTGYKIGEVPPVGTGLDTYIDEKVLDFETVLAGGGSTHTLIELSPKKIVEYTGGKVAEIS